MAIRCERARPIVVPAHAGTHTPRTFDSNTVLRRRFCSRERQGLWVPAFAGTTKNSANTRRRSKNMSSLRKQGPIRRGFSFRAVVKCLLLQSATVIMGPRFRGDDIEVYHLDCASLRPSYAHDAVAGARRRIPNKANLERTPHEA